MSDVATPQLPVTTPAVKETKAQKAERLKLAKNPWDAWEEVRQFAREGRGAVPPEWAEFYFKWWGVYTQGDGLGVTGGKDGQGKATEYFMMRIALPNGLLSSRQLRVVGQITQKYAQNLADKNNEDLDVDQLYVSEAYVNEGPRQKRVRPAPMGRAYRVQKRTSHIVVKVAEK